jgi:hypothetical protein
MIQSAMPQSFPIPHPEWDDLLQKRDALHSQIAAVLTDLHSLADSGPVVIGHYAVAFGDRLTRLHAAEIETARLKREIDLVQAAINSGRELDYNQIQATLDAEFAEWQAKLKAEADNLTRHREALDHLLDPAKVRALRERFRVLARRLHPDLNPSQAPAEAELWHRVTAAYDTNDIEELDALEILTRDVDSVPVPDSMETLRGILQKLRDMLDHFLISLAKRRDEWPFDQLPVLDDPAATTARQADLDARILAAENSRDERKHWLNQLLDH